MRIIPIIFRIVRQGDFIFTFPKCTSRFVSSICKTVLPDAKFKNKLVLNDLKIESEKNNF